MPRPTVIDERDPGMSARFVGEHEIVKIPDDIPVLVRGKSEIEKALADLMKRSPKIAINAVEAHVEHSCSLINDIKSGIEIVRDFELEAAIACGLWDIA